MLGGIRINARERENYAHVLLVPAILVVSAIESRNLESKARTLLDVVEPRILTFSR